MMQKNNPTPAPVVDVNDVCRITEGTKLTGNLVSTSDIRVDGEIEGYLCSKSRIVIGEKAVIKGTIVCSQLDFWGTLEGDIYVSDILSLKSTSSVKGSININKLQIEVGAQLNGECKMISEEEFEKAQSSLQKAA